MKNSKIIFKWKILLLQQMQVFFCQFGKLEWSFRVFQGHFSFSALNVLYWRRKCPLCQPHQCHSEHRGFHPSEGMFVSVCLFSAARPWSLSLFSLRGCEQKAIKPLQSLVRERYRNERWRDRADAWAATHFTLKWGNDQSEG